MLLTFLFTEDASDLVIFLRYFFCCYPPFSYTKVTLFLFRFLQILPNIQDIILVLPKEDGLLLRWPIISENLARIYKVSYLLVVEIIIDTLILYQCSSCLEIAYFLLFSLGILIILSLQIVGEDNLSIFL